MHPHETEDVGCWRVVHRHHEMLGSEAEKLFWGIAVARHDPVVDMVGRCMGLHCMQCAILSLGHLRINFIRRRMGAASHAMRKIRMLFRTA